MNEARFWELYDAGNERLDRANELLARMNYDPLCDNLALLFATEAEMFEFVEFGVGLGMEHFHKDEHDTVYGAIGHRREQYSVHFEFLRWPSGTRHMRPYRIEAMHISAGTSTIHSRALALGGSGMPVQVSLKVPDVWYMEKMHRRMEDVGMVYTEMFISNYGPYSYWRAAELGDTYMKVRINMRDKEQSSGAE